MPSQASVGMKRLILEGREKKTPWSVLLIADTLVAICRAVEPLPPRHFLTLPTRLKLIS
jgi:hypothetical protein